mmetsp:Transcript_29429/g.57594  ORF Transcript_29429/g.57594 Transcript_29429/m.57594 type:complete len:340 (-) Transcript_29429:1033-2052(-)
MGRTAPVFLGNHNMQSFDGNRPFKRSHLIGQAQFKHLLHAQKLVQHNHIHVPRQQHLKARIRRRGLFQGHKPLGEPVSARAVQIMGEIARRSAQGLAMHVRIAFKGQAVANTGKGQDNQIDQRFGKVKIRAPVVAGIACTIRHKPGKTHVKCGAVQHRKQVFGPVVFPGDGICGRLRRDLKGRIDQLGQHSLSRPVQVGERGVIRPCDQLNLCVVLLQRGGIDNRFWYLWHLRFLCRGCGRRRLCAHIRTGQFQHNADGQLNQTPTLHIGVGVKDQRPFGQIAQLIFCNGKERVIRANGVGRRASLRRPCPSQAGGNRTGRPAVQNSAQMRDICALTMA